MADNLKLAKARAVVETMLNAAAKGEPQFAFAAVTVVDPDAQTARVEPTDPVIGAGAIGQPDAERNGQQEPSRREVFMLDVHPGTGIRDFPCQGNSGFAPVVAGLLTIEQRAGNFEALENGSGTNDEFRQVSVRTFGEILLENNQLRQELRRLRMQTCHIEGEIGIGDQAASLAHEIKQPIAAAALDAMVCLRCLRHDLPDLAQAREAANRMIADVTRAASIVDRVRSFYRVGTPKREPVDLNEIICGVVPVLRDFAARNSVSVHTELDSELPTVSADFLQMQQVLINLMTNGIEAMHDIGGQLTVTSQMTHDGQILVAVSDLGVGLPAGRIENIFEAFFTTKPEGTGLGLAISRTIIESHGGRLWAGTNAGRGATFKFTLPADCHVPASQHSSSKDLLSLCPVDKPTSRSLSISESPECRRV